MTTTALLVHNPAAGVRPVPREALERALAHAGFAPRAVCAKSDDLDATIAAALAEPVGLVVAAGGDGTVAKVMARMRGPTPPLAILPLGTANNLARALGLPASWQDVAGALRGAACRWFAPAVLETAVGATTVVETVDIGALAQGLDAASRNHRCGAEKIAHGRATIVRTLRAAEPIRIPIAIDGGAPAVEEALFAAVLNIGLTGPGLRLSDVEPGGGALEIATLPAAGREAFVGWLERGGEELAPLTRRRARHVVLLPPRGAPLRIDDAVRRVEAAAPLAVAPRADPLAVLVPTSRRSS